MSKKFKIGVTGDNHFHHNAVPTARMVSNFNHYIIPYIKLLDMFVINGDFFDKLVAHDSKDVHLIQLLIVAIIKECIIHNVKLRVLKGTPSHDNDQCQHFVTLYEALQTHYHKPIDFKYHDTLTIEHIEPFGHCMFMPDKFGTDPNDAYDRLITLMGKLNVIKLDYAFMHGAFEFQLPYVHEKFPVHHNSDKYLDLVNGYIFINHVHTRMIYDRIVMPGSTERLSQGDEISKGWIIYSYDESAINQHDIQFIENKGTTPFITLEFQDEPLSDIIKHVDEVVTPLKIPGYIRLKVPDGHPLLTYLKPIRDRHPTFVFTVDVIKEKPISKDPFKLTNKRVVQHVDRTTLNAMVLKRIEDHEPFEHINKVKIILNEIRDSL